MKILSLLTLFISFNCYADDEFVTVEKYGVTHKFCKMNNGWPDRFTKDEFKEWENDTFDVFTEVKNPKGSAIDIGAWIGTTAIWLSKNFSYVVAVEADKQSVFFLKKNLALSDSPNVLVCEKAISHDGEPVVFGPRLSRGDVLNSSTSCIKTLSEANNSKNNYVISTLTLNQIIDQYLAKTQGAHPVTFIKCDIEGGEEGILTDILDYAEKNKCSVWMSFHYDWWSNKNINDYRQLFSKFNSNCPSADICGYIKDNPFASILFKPKCN